MEPSSLRSNYPLKRHRFQKDIFNLIRLVAPGGDDDTNAPETAIWFSPRDFVENKDHLLAWPTNPVSNLWSWVIYVEEGQLRTP
jgi:hypothetical protein